MSQLQKRTNEAIVTLEGKKARLISERELLLEKRRQLNLSIEELEKKIAEVHNAIGLIGERHVLDPLGPP